MSKYSEKISEILKNADSKKVSDKKKCIIELLGVYENKEALNEISKNTEESVKGIANWPYIMHTVHKLLLNEADRSAAKDKSQTINVRQNMSTIVLKTVREANNCRKPLLKNSDLVPLVLQILATKTYEHYHDTYLTILINYILPIRVHQVNMLPEQWKELLKIGIELYKNVSSNVNKRTILDALQMIVEYGCLHSDLLHKVKKILPFIENVFLDIKVHQETLTEVAYKFTNTVYQQIGTESRIALCKLSENILPSIISSNSSNEKHKLLLTIIRIHHPRGVRDDHNNAYAYDRNNWKRIFQSMYSIILRDCKPDILPKTFVQFASEVFRQIFRNSSYVWDGNSANEGFYSQIKRRRIETKVEGPIDIIADCNPEQAWPMIQILKTFVEKYPDGLKLKDYMQLLEVLANLITNSRKHEGIMDSLYELAAVLVKVEKIYLKDLEAKDSKLFWDIIWDVLLRSLSMKQNETSGHKLIQLFIEKDKMLNSNALLKLYVTKAIQWSPNSMRTLTIFCEHVSLPNDISVFNLNLCNSHMNSNSVKLYLIKWILDIPWCKMATDIPVDDICNLLIMIISKSCYKKGTKTENHISHIIVNNTQNMLQEQEELHDSECMFFKDIELCHASLTYEIDIFIRKEMKSILQNIRKSSNIIYIEELRDILLKNLDDIIKDSHESDNLQLIIMQVAFVAKLISTLSDLNIISENIEDLSLINTVKMSLQNICKSLTDIDLSKTKYVYLSNITKALNILYGTLHNTYVAKIIVSSTTFDMLKNIYNLLNLEDQDIIDYHNIKDYYKKYDTFEGRSRYADKEQMYKPNNEKYKEGTIRLQAIKALTHFCCMNTGDNKFETQIRALKNLLMIDMYDLKCMTNFKMAMLVLETLLTYDERQLYENYMHDLMNFLSKLTSQCYKDEKCVYCILDILPYFSKYVGRHVERTENLMDILQQIYKYLCDGKYGLRSHTKFIKTLSKIIEINPAFFWSIWYNSSTKATLITECILSYFSSPYYIVRLQVIQYIQDVLSLKNIDVKWKSLLFVELKQKIINLFIIDKDLRNHEKADERETRIASALLLLAIIICTDGILQSHALLAMLQLAVDKQIHLQTMQNVLHAVTMQTNDSCLIENNLSYLLLHWFDSEYPLKLFPWSIMQHESEEQFYREHINILIPLKIQRLHIYDIILFCKRIELPFEVVFKDAFPQIFSWLLSHICESKSNDSTAKFANEIFQKLLSNEGEFKTIQKFSILLNDNFNEIIFNLISRLHDEEYFNKIFDTEVSFPETNPPHFRKETVDKCLKYIEENFFVRKNSIQYILATNYQNVLQEILLRLTTNIYKMKFLEHKLKAFQQYTYFCTIILEELKEDYFSAISMYLIRDISYTLLHLIKCNDDLLIELVCKYLNIFLQYTLPTRSTEIKEILSLCVTTLVPLVQSKKTCIALDILEFLIIDQKDILYDAIKKLNSFPNISEFERIRNIHNHLKYKTEKIYDLEKEIQHFLNGVSDINLNCSVEELSHLKLQLSTRKKELQSLYDKLETLHNFVEECAVSVLHQLIYKLVKLTNSCSINISMEAAKCLGEIGPGDLTTTILHVDKNYMKESVNLVEILSYKIIALLINFSVESDIELRIASTKALYVILSSPWGQKLSDESYLKNLQTTLESSETALYEYIKPFIPRKKIRTSKVINVHKDKVKEIMDPSNSIWTQKSKNIYSSWITDITSLLIDCITGFYSDCLIPVCKLNIQLCKLILPRSIFLIISINNQIVSNVCDCINQFFHYHFNPANITANESCSMQKHVLCDHETVHCMLDVVNYIRIQASDNILLKLDYMYIAKAAQYCSAYFTAVFYAELCCESLLIRFPSFKNVSKIDYLYETNSKQGKELQDILRDAYLKIGDPDAIYGCGSSYLEDQSSRVQHYIHTSQWDKVMLTQDIELSFGNKTAQKDMMNALHQSGFQYVLGQLMCTSNKQIEEMDYNFQYEYSWRLSNWNLCDLHDRTNSHSNVNIKSQIGDDYYLHHYEALKFLHESDEKGIQTALQNARLSVIKALCNVSLESSKTVYEKLMQLQMLHEIEELSSVKSDCYSDIIDKWQEYNTAGSNEFQYVEPILMQRIVMYQIKSSMQNNFVVKGALANTYLQIAETAENQGYLQIAARALGCLAKQSDCSSEINDKLRYHEALLSWTRNDHEVGRYLLSSLINKKFLKPGLKAKVLQIYGNWMAETKSENSQAIINNYYMESINISLSIDNKTADDTKNLCSTQVALARYADTQYEQISTYMKSPQFENLKECIQYSCNEIKLSTTSKDRDFRKAVFQNQKQSINDAAELKNIQRERNNYLILALRYYLITLYQSDDYNLLIFRLTALWLDNMHNDEVNKLLEEDLCKIPSFKFIPLVPQLAAHMSNVLDEFSLKVYQILERCTVEHPHHTLPVLLALKNLYEDHKFSDKNVPKIIEQPRVLGAKRLLRSVTQINIKNTLEQMEKLSHSLVTLAYFKSDKSGPGKIYKIPKNQEILKIKNFEHLLVPTLTINVKPCRNYDDVVGIWKYAETYETVGGVNVPKKITCIGTDGILRKQLIKGKDDLRQDAVMQQVFNVINILLKMCKETKRRKLKIRTYKVVPLTQRSGILEWCENTVPVAILLIGSDGVSGVHKKYYPNDYTANLCRKKLRVKLAEDVSKASNDIKLKTFMECCDHMHPAFHHFFMEKYQTSEIWFEKKLTYTRSVATSSIAGYILGLGDRHLSNILFDQSTAELIHIDFGVAFEEGKVLPVPETVPFRLTRDIEVAMGVSGVEGTMRRSCEETLTVLRDQKQIIITLLQVLLYDPLFTWTITPAKACNLQRDSAAEFTECNQVSIETNKTAERALFRTEQKLQGTEEGLTSSIAGQVEKLIQQARDPSNLCRLYSGWQPYL